MTFIVHVDDIGQVAMLGLNETKENRCGTSTSRNVGAAVIRCTQANI